MEKQIIYLNSGVAGGMKFRNRWITIPSLAATVMSAILLVATVIVG